MNVRASRGTEEVMHLDEIGQFDTGRAFKFPGSRRLATDGHDRDVVELLSARRVPLHVGQ